MVQDTQGPLRPLRRHSGDTPNCLLVRITVFAAMTASVQTYHH
jgi:hypothetical protein